jgi:hypothetical protein
MLYGPGMKAGRHTTGHWYGRGSLAYAVGVTAKVRGRVLHVVASQVMQQCQLRAIIQKAGIVEDMMKLAKCITSAFMIALMVSCETSSEVEVLALDSQSEIRYAAPWVPSAVKYSNAQELVVMGGTEPTGPRRDCRSRRAVSARRKPAGGSAPRLLSDTRGALVCVSFSSR